MRTTHLLVGRAGNGKSSVGNSILGQQVFAPRRPSEETRLQNEIACNDQFVVVDCSGIGDTGSDMQGDMSSITLSAFDALIINNNAHDGLQPLPSDQKTKVLHRCGFDALILVLKYGVRFTKQEKDAVQMVKSIFGENVFRDWGILVFSYGDNFNLDVKERDKSFDDWCKEQRGEIKSLFEEVRYRCVLFDNKTKDEDELEKQRCELNEHILTLCRPENVDLKLNKYFLEDFISTRMAHIIEKYKRLDHETKRLLTMTKSNEKNKSNKTTFPLQAKLIQEWGNMRKEIEGQMEYFSWEEKTPVNAKEEDSTPANVKDDESTLAHAKDDESTPANAKDDESTLANAKDDESTPVNAKDDESILANAKDDESTLANAKDDESTLANAKDDESTPVNAKDDESILANAKDDESTLANAKDDESTKVNAKDDETTPVNATDDKTTPVNATDDETTPVNAKDEESTPANVKDDESTLAHAKDDESTPANAKDDESTLANAKDDESTKVNAKDDESILANAKDDESTPANAKDDESTPVNAKVDESTPVNAKDDESTLAIAKVDESTPVNAQDNESTLANAKDDETTPVNAKDDESTPVNAKDDETTPAIAKDDKSTLANAKDDESTTVNAKDNESTPVNAKVDESTPANAKDDESTPVNVQQVDKEEHNPRRYKEEQIKSKLKNNHYVIFRRCHKCRFNVKHENTCNAYAKYLNDEQSLINNNIKNLTEIGNTKCV